jgi:hypothetical protein
MTGPFLTLPLILRIQTLVPYYFHERAARRQPSTLAINRRP